MELLLLVLIVIVGIAVVFLFSSVKIPKSHQVGKTYYEGGGRRFVLTGAASGIARHLTGVLLDQGHIVLATDNNVNGLKEAHEKDGWADKKGKVITRKLDVTCVDDWKSASEIVMSEMKGVDVLLNIAGFLRPGKIQSVTERDVSLHIDVNVKGVVHGTRIISELMRNQVAEGTLPNGGHIVNIASLGAIAPVAGYAMYITSKYAVRGFSICAAKDLFESGVYVSVVCPDAVATPMVYETQLNSSDAALAFSGQVLSLKKVQSVILDEVLPNRLREVFIPSDFIRGKFARLADIFHSSRIIYYAEKIMSAQGRKVQQRLRKTH